MSTIAQIHCRGGLQAYPVNTTTQEMAYSLLSISSLKAVREIFDSCVLHVAKYCRAKKPTAREVALELDICTLKGKMRNVHQCNTSPDQANWKDCSFQSDIGEYVRGENRQEACDNYRNWVKNCTETEPYNKGLLHGLNKEIIKAENDFHFAAYSYLAEKAISAKDHKRAKAIIRRMPEGDAKALFNAKILVQERKLSRAWHEVFKILDIPSRDRAADWLARVYLDEEKIDLALKAIVLIFDLFLIDSLYNKLFNLYLNKDDLQTAKLYADKFAEICKKRCKGSYDFTSSVDDRYALLVQKANKILSFNKKNADFVQSCYESISDRYSGREKSETWLAFDQFITNFLDHQQRVNIKKDEL